VANVAKRQGVVCFSRQAQVSQISQISADYPKEGLPFLTAPSEWCGGDAPTHHERTAAIGGFVGAADGLDVILEVCGQCEAFCGQNFAK
jgi:hypothetical protein